MEIVIPDSTQLQMETGGIVARARALQIVDSATYLLADEYRKEAVGTSQLAHKMFDEIIELAHGAHKKALANRNLISEPCDEVAKTCKRKQIDYDQEQKAKAERERIRLEAEQAVAREADRKRQEDDRLAIATTLEEAGLDDAAEQLLDEEIPVLPAAPISVPVDTPTVEHFSYRSNWTFALYCFACKRWVKRSLLLMHGDHALDYSEIPREYLIPDLTKIGREVTKSKLATNIPGVEVIEEKV
jgi:hypothetical protein